MARINIDTGTLGNAATGDTLRTAMTKINTNFVEVYSLIADGSSGLIATDVTNGDLKLQANGTGVIEIDQLQVSGDSITSIATNGSVDITGNGTGGVNIEALTFNGTSITSSDSSSINLNENVDVDGDLNVTGNITGNFSVNSIGDITAVGSTLSTPSNADFDLTPGGTGNVNLNGDTVRVGDNNTDATITTQGTGDLTLSTNSGTNSGTIKIADGANGDITLDTDGTGDVLLKGDKVGIGTVNQPDTLLHLKDTNAVITLQRTADANTPGLSFQNSNGNVRGVIKLDGTSGTSNEIFMQTYDGSSQAERFRVTHTGAKVSGTLNVDDGISITDNTITTSASNANLELSAAGSGEVTTDTNFKLISGTPFLKIQRTDNANVPGIDFLGQAGTSGAKILFDGTGGTANELSFQTFTVGGGIAEAFRVQGGGAKVTGTLDVDGGISITDNSISATRSNDNLELKASGTGSVSIDGIQISGTEISSSDSTQVTIKENLHVTGNITGTFAGSIAFSNVTSTPTTLAGYGITDAASATATALTVVGDDSSGTAVTLGETFKVAGATGITTAVSGDTLTITGPTLTSFITASSSDTLTNKTIDANGTGNSISNLEVADFAGSAIINVAETLASNDSDTALVTAGAIIDYVDAQDGNIASDTLTFTNKTFDVEGTGNSISNIDVADFKAAAIVTAAEGIGSNNNDTTIPTSAAVKAYADSVGGGGSTGDLTFTGSTISAPSNADLTLTTSGTGSVSVDAIQIKGTEISSTDSTQVTIKENLHVTGALTVAGSTLSGTLNTAGNTGTGSVALASESLQVTGTTNEINVDAAAFALSLSLADNISGIVSVTASSFLANDAIKIVDNQITGLRSNEDITLDPAGTGQVVANAAVKFNAGYVEKINTLTSSSTITVDCSAASIHKVTLATNTEFNISNLPTGGTVTLIITQDGSGSRTATFGTDGSTAVKFPGGAPTLSTGAGDIDVVTIVNDGTNFLGNCAKDYA